MKQRCPLNNEERRFFDGEKVLVRTNGKTARRDWFPEGIQWKRQSNRIPSIRSHYQGAHLFDQDSQNSGQKKRI